MRTALLLCAVAAVASAAGPHLVTKSKRLSVREGNTISLPCVFRHIDDDASIIWKRNEQPLFIDDDYMGSDERYSVIYEKGNSTLEIAAAEPLDQASYTCALSDPELEVTHHVVVEVAPTIVVSPDSMPYAVLAGEKNVVLNCKAQGNPLPKVHWMRKNGKMESDVINNGNLLTIKKAERKHSGEYVCEASNSAGVSHHTVHLNVNDDSADTEEAKAPVVTTEQSYVPVKKGASVNVTCRYDGVPAPTISWKFNGFGVNLGDSGFENSRQFGNRGANYTETILEISNISEENFGDYMCQAQNQHGHAQRVVHVSGRPGPPALSVDRDELTFTLQSYDKIIEYKLMYRETSADTWQNHEVIRSKKNDNMGDDQWEHTVSLLPYLQRGLRYELQVQARNSLGWGSMARDYVTVEIPAGDSISSSASLMASGVAAAVAMLLF